MTIAEPVYCIDSSSIIHAWRRAYPPAVFASLWKKIDLLIDGGRLTASIEVLHELKKKDDDVYNWAKDRKESLFSEVDDDTQESLVLIMTNYPKLVDTGKGKSGGDPFVIALAHCRNPKLTVVTEEKGGSDQKPRIPHVCNCLGVLNIDVLNLITQEKWSF
jgi:hypothetical protein